MDLSFSMKDDLENVKNLGTDLMAEMQKITSDFKIGKQNTAPNEMMIIIIIRNKTAFFFIIVKDIFTILNNTHSTFRFRLICGEDGHAVHQHHASQAHQPLHREPELYQPLQL